MYEIASLGVPCICLCQNERELSHIFGNVEHGFINLGLGSDVSKEEIKETFESTINDYQLRQEMNKRMSEVDLKHGFDNIKRLIKQSYKEWKEEMKKGKIDEDNENKVKIWAYLMKNHFKLLKLE